MPQGLFRIGEVSRRTGVSVDLIRAWERRYGLLKPARSEANFRLYSADDLARLRLMRHYVDQRIAPSRAAALVKQARTATLQSNPGIPFDEVRRSLATLHDTLERFDAGPAEVLLARLSALFTPAVVLRDIVLPYLCELGDRWECGETTVAQEHFASCFLESWMLISARGWGRGGTRRAVLACVAGEQHVLGLIAFGIVLRDLGWAVTYIGRDTPATAISRVAEAVAPDAIVLSATTPERVEAAAANIAELGRRLPVYAGGPGTARAPSALLAPARLLPGDVLAAARDLSAQIDDAGRVRALDRQPRAARAASPTPRSAPAAGSGSRPSR